MPRWYSTQDKWLYDVRSGLETSGRFSALWRAKEAEYGKEYQRQILSEIQDQSKKNRYQTPEQGGEFSVKN